MKPIRTWLPVLLSWVVVGALGCAEGLPAFPEGVAGTASAGTGGTAGTPSSTPPVSSTCGNGILDQGAGEECDCLPGTSAMLCTIDVGLDCTTLNRGFTGGRLLCNACRLDTRACTAPSAAGAGATAFSGAGSGAGTGGAGS